MDWPHNGLRRGITNSCQSIVNSEIVEALLFTCLLVWAVLASRLLIPLPLPFWEFVWTELQTAASETHIQDAALVLVHRRSTISRNPEKKVADINECTVLETKFIWREGKKLVWFNLYKFFFQMETRGFVRKILEAEYVWSRQWSVFVYIQMNQVVGGNVSWCTHWWDARANASAMRLLRRCGWNGIDSPSSHVHFSFLPRDATQSAVLLRQVCPSIYLSVCLWRWGIVIT